MTEQKNQASLPISDEELDAATGGAMGINPLLLLASGGQGIYTATAEPAAAPAVHANPLYVDNSHVAAPASPGHTPPVEVVPTPVHAIPSSIAPPAHVASVTITPPPAHESTVLVVSPSGMGQSLDIPSHPASQPVLLGSITISGNIGVPSSMNIDHTPPSVTVMTFDHNPGPAVAISPTIRGERFASEDTKAGHTGSLNQAFDLSLVNK